MGCFKYPPNEMLSKLWSDHIYSILHFIEIVHSGIKGIVTNNKGEPISNATVTILSGGNGKNITTTNLGEYWRILTPSNYTVNNFFNIII